MLLTPLNGVDAHMYRDSSNAPLLDLRRRLKVVVDVLSDVIRSGFTLARTVELHSQGWSCTPYFY